MSIVATSFDTGITLHCIVAATASASNMPM